MKFTWKNTGHGATDNLGKQMQKIVRTMNQNSFKTKYRYIQAEKRFIDFVAKEFKLKKLSNIKDKHLEKYANYMKENGKADKYIKNEFSGIRFFHNHTPATKYELTDSTIFNKRVHLNSTGDGKADRAWTEREVNGMKSIAIERERPEISNVIDGIRSTGMRIDEACSLKRIQIENALKTGKLHLVNTKGGLPRDIPLTDRARAIFEKQLKNTNRGEYVFTPRSYVENHKIHSFEKSIQNFIGYHRQKIQEHDRSSSGHNCKEGDRGALTVHGLRHSFARAQYFQMREDGLSKEDARIEVSKMLGHGRDSVTYIYLGGIDDD